MDGYFGRSVIVFGLLNVLDGLVVGEDRIVFLMMNYIDKFDLVLIRLGRVDMMVRIGEVLWY